MTLSGTDRTTRNILTLILVLIHTTQGTVATLEWGFFCFTPVGTVETERRVGTLLPDPVEELGGRD